MPVIGFRPGLEPGWCEFESRHPDQDNCNIALQTPVMQLQSLLRKE